MPLPVIRTRRTLRPWTREDTDELHELWTAPEVRRYLWDDSVITRETAVQLVDSHLAAVENHGIGFWVLHVPPEDQRIAGFCGFRLTDNGPEIELMYGLRGNYWGQGLATEACAAALEYLWRSTKYQRVYARTDPPNRRSVKVIERLGMTHESTAPATVTYLLQRAEPCPAHKLNR